MFLKNFYKMLGMHLGASNTNVTSGTDGLNTSGARVAFAFYDNVGVSLAYRGDSGWWPCITQTPTSQKGTGVVFGDGSTPPTIDDYQLSGNQLTTFTATANLTRSSNADGVTISCSYTITNNGTEDFTIREVGLIGIGNSNTFFMIERSLLDTPVTIAPDGVGQVTYTVRLNFPTA